MSVYFDENGKICYKNEKQFYYGYESNLKSELQGYTISSTTNDEYDIYIEQVRDPYSFEPVFRYHLHPKKKEVVLEDELFQI